MAGFFGVPASPPPPDLSNLTEEEKQIIQSVLERQKQMEDETNQLQRNLQKEVESYQSKVERKTGQSVNSREENVCEICHKTKFTDGTGKECKYCKLKVCARCGVQVTIPGTKQASQGQGLSLFSNLIQDFKTLALGPEVCICLLSSHFLAFSSTFSVVSLDLVHFRMLPNLLELKELLLKVTSSRLLVFYLILLLHSQLCSV